MPSRGSAAGGGDLISFAPDDPKDATGVKMNGRFGRRFTNNGLWFESPDKVFQFHVGGRTQMDASFFSAGNTVQFGPGGIGKLRDGVDARRMRVRLEGAMYENMLFCMEFDFINSSIPQGTSGAGPLTSVANTPAAGIPVPLDLWVTFRNIPYIGHIRIGNQKEPIGFERLTSSRFLNFMERSFNQDAFYGPYDNGFVPGISTFSTYADRRGTYALGVFKNVTNPFAYDVGGGNYKVTGRLTGLLLYEDEGREVMHLGISGRESGYDNGLQRFRVRGPERAGISTVWPLYANTGVFDGSGGQQDLNLESVNVFGPWTIDAEYHFHWSQNAFLPGQAERGDALLLGRIRRGPLLPDRRAPRLHPRVGPLRPHRPAQECLLGRGQEGRPQRVRLRGVAGRRPLQLPEPQRQGDQRRRPQRPHPGPELVHQPEHEVPVELQRHRPPFADRPERRHDPGLRHALRHGLLSGEADVTESRDSDHADPGLPFLSGMRRIGPHLRDQGSRQESTNPTDDEKHAELERDLSLYSD